jgi:hypothetical protein
VARFRRVLLASRSGYLPHHIIGRMWARDTTAFRGRSEMSGRFKDFHWRWSRSFHGRGTNPSHFYSGLMEFGLVLRLLLFA